MFRHPEIAEEGNPIGFITATAPAFHVFMLRRLEAALERHVEDISAGREADRSRDGRSAAQP